jgi:hypothetical protein
VAETDFDQDRYPDIHDVVAKVFAAENFPLGPVGRLEVTCQASGEATWRAYPPRADEPESGYFAEGS